MQFVAKLRIRSEAEYAAREISGPLALIYIGVSPESSEWGSPSVTVIAQPGILKAELTENRARLCEKWHWHSI